MNIQHKIILNEAKDYFFIAFGLFLYTIAFTVFLMPYQIVAGGVTGLSAIIYYATGFHLENTYIIINGILLLVALKILGVRFLMKTIFAIFTLYFMLKFAQDIIPKQENGLPFKLMGEGQDFMSMIIGCVITGIALATVFMNNGSTGGTDIIAASVNKFHPNVTLGNVLIAADFCIIGSCMFYPQFGTLLERAHKVMFGFCVMAMENYTLDYVMNARRQSVQISEKVRLGAFTLNVIDTAGITQTDDPIEKIGVERARGEIEGAQLILYVADSSVELDDNDRDILGESIEVLSLKDINCDVDIPETGKTLEENALQKAQYVYDHYHLDCFADDTGLEVEALDGAPGVYSARYAGEGHDSEANMTKLLKELGNNNNRKARFRTVITLIQKKNICPCGCNSIKEIHQFEGIVNGEIIRERRGGEGFGYDPIFQPDGYDQTFAELGMDIKNHISHRARATQKLADYLLKIKT